MVGEGEGVLRLGIRSTLGRDRVRDGNGSCV